MKDRPACVVLAAGKSTRMNTERPKVLHELAGRPLLDHVMDLAVAVNAGRTILMAGHKYDIVKEYSLARYKKAMDLKVVEQTPQLGTGHAVSKALPALRGQQGTVIVLYGDVPLLRPRTLKRLISSYRRKKADVAFLSMVLDDAGGYGRVVRDGKNKVQRIVEAADADPDELSIREVNAGIYCFNLSFLRKAARRLGKDNAQGEFYLTDTVKMAAVEGSGVVAEICDFEEAIGINDRKDLALAGSVLQARVNENLFRSGVTMTHPESVVIHPTVKVGRDSILGFGVHLLGDTKVGRNCRVEAGSCLVDTLVEDDVWVKPYTVADGAVIRKGAQVGPFSHLRPGSDVGPGAKTGNFVEMKKAVLHRGVKANHLSYLGDCEIGEGTNVGAGTITCNYDGVAKHRTRIGAGVMIGSDTQLVAPVTVGDDAYIGAGTTVLKDIPEGCLAINPKSQLNTLRKSKAERNDGGKSGR